MYNLHCNEIVEYNLEYELMTNCLYYCMLINKREKNTNWRDSFKIQKKIRKKGHIR